MASVAGAGSAGRRQGRCWRFGTAVFDERSWTLSVEGERVALEAKPMELLRELLLRGGEVVTKDELLDAVWPGVSVVEAVLPTAIAKLRRALGDNQVIGTVPRVGYRFEGELLAEPAPEPVEILSGKKPRRWLAAAGVAVVLAGSGLAAAEMARPKPVTRDEVLETMHTLDTARLHELIARGWDINTPIDKEGDSALAAAIEICEWNPAHDRMKLMQFVRVMLDQHARFWERNAFGDTAYSIAKAKRYCGPGHPVTKLLHAACYNGSTSPGAKCEADYPPAPPKP